MKIKVFISYGHNDNTLSFPGIVNEQFRTLIKDKELYSQVELLYDNNFLYTSTDWNHDIINQINTSDIVLCLLSEKFFASEYITEVERPLILERNKNNQSKLIICKLFTCNDVPEYNHMQALNLNDPYFLKSENEIDDRDKIKISKAIALELKDFIDNNFLQGKHKYIEEVYLEKINRDKQIRRFNRSYYSTFKTNNILFFYCINDKYDAIHFLNNRIQNIELNEKKLNINSTNYISETLINEKDIYIILDLLVELYFKNKKYVDSIDDFIEQFNNSNLNNILIPVLIDFNIDINEETKYNLNEFLINFNKSAELIKKDKKIIFLISFQREVNSEIKPDINNIFKNLPIHEYSNLEILNKISLSDIDNWLSNNFSSDVLQREIILKKYFNNFEGKKSMAEIINSVKDKIVDIKKIIN